MTVLEINRRRDRQMSALVACVTIVAAVLTFALVEIERSHDGGPINWIVFGVLGTLLFLAETRPSFTMKVGESGTISPGWTFAYALMLFGMPLEALAVLVVASFTDSVLGRKHIRIALFNASVLAASLASGALVLHAFGMHGPMTSKSTIPLPWGIAIILGACAMLLLNGLVIAIAIGLHTGTGFITVLRTGLAVSMTADGALLSLAPVFVIAIDFSLALVPLLATTSYIVVRSARKSLQRAHDANHDPLTGLLNRRAFHDRLTYASGPTDAVPTGLILLMDFDRFKDINDSLGHASGDALLVGFGERLLASLPATAAAARLGGDEFAVLLPGERSIAEARRVVAELHAALTEPYDIAGFPLSMSVSIGVARAPEHGRSADELIAAADLAMYRAKQPGRAVEFHESTTNSPSHTPVGVGRIGLLGGLAGAIGKGQLSNEYQPMIDTVTGRIDTVEALVRWNHPQHGWIMPNDFIDMAEQTDLIDALTDDVLRRAMLDVLSLTTDLKLAVNVSARSLHQRTFANSVFDAAAEAGFPTDRLEFEITERALASDPDRIQLTLARLREAGISIAIDDFGTGYSSFGSLRQIRADRLKIDRSFTARVEDSPEDRLVVRTITDLGHGLGLQVVAEGVETDSTLEIIRDLGCDYSQGYGIARPMGIVALRHLVTTEQVAPKVEFVA